MSRRPPLRLPLLAALLVATPAWAQDAPETAASARTLDGIETAQVTIRERIMIRIRPARPVRMRRAGPMGRPVAIPAPVWSERRGPRCIPVRALAGGAVSQGGDVDLLMVDGGRLRAKLQADCPALDFYRGFYLRPAPDGRICGQRDVLRARSGAACPIMRFRRLEMQR